MTDKGFGIYLPDDYVPHPKTEGERNELVKQVRGYQRPNYASCKYVYTCLLYTSPSPRDVEESRMPSSA